MKELLAPPILHTARLTLRPPTADDLDGFYAFGSEPDTMEHLGGVKSRHEIYRAVCGLAGAWQIRGYGFFSVLERATGTWIGRVGPHYPEGWPAREIGWGLLSGYTGRGYAREAAAACIDYAFDVLGWTHVHHVIAPQNMASARLARALGSRGLHPVTLPPPLTELRVDLWGQSREAWRARPAV